MTLINIQKEKISHLNNPRNLAHAHFDLAQIYLKRHMVKLAISSYEQAQSYGRNSFKTNKLFEVKIFFGLGNSYALLKEFKTALKYHLNASKLIENIPNQNELNSLILHAKAKEYIELKKHKEAIKALEEALSISIYEKGELDPKTVEMNCLLAILQQNKVTFKTSLKSYKLLYGKNSLEVANLYVNIAKQKSLKKNYKEALEKYQYAIQIYREKLPFLHEKIYETYYKMALVEKNLKHHKEYFNNALDAFDSFYENQNIIFSTLTSKEKRDYIQKNSIFITELFQACKTNAPKKLFNRWINYKRKLYEEENALSRLSVQGEDEKNIQQLKLYKKKLAQTYQELHVDIPLTKILKTKITKLERSLSLTLFYTKEKHRTLNHKKLSQVLKSKELYIDFAKIVDNYYLFIINSESKVTLEKISNKKSKEIDNLVKYFQEDINKNNHLKKKDFQYLMGKLYEIIFNKVSLNGITSLIVSPDSSLNLIPFETLFDQTTKQYLIEKLTISYIPSGRELLEQEEQEELREKFVIFAKSDFLNYQDLNNLKYTIEESNKIKNIYPTASLFQEEQASKTNLFHINRPKILHLSTHGTYNKKDQEFNPMLNTFIYLDKPISGLELSTLNLKGTELVVLSACQTGVGEVENAEGVSSMAKALLEAGAKNTLVSLWVIEDKVTSRLMELFYEKIKKGLSYKIALQQAKLSLLKESDAQEPYLWAPMILIGK